MEIVALDETQKLPDLVGLRLTADVLKIQELLNPGVGENVMTAAYPLELETERLGETHQLSKGYVLQMALGKASEKAFVVHAFRSLARYSSGSGFPGRSLSHSTESTHQRPPSWKSWMLLMPRPWGAASGERRYS